MIATPLAQAALRSLAVPVGLGYVLARDGNGVDAALAVVTGVLVVAGSRWPVVALCGQTAALVCAHAFGQSAGLGVKVWAALALFEVGLRRPPRDQIACATALSACYVGIELWAADDAAPLPYRLALLVAAPLLAGAQIAALRRRAADAEANADLRAAAARRAERESIARDLHDVVAHHVSAIMVRVGTARHVPRLGDAEVARLLADVHAAADTALRDLHDLLHVLRDESGGGAVGSAPVENRTALPAMLADLLASAADAGLAVDGRIDPAVAALDGVRGLVLYRTAQEAITNAVKHSGDGSKVRLDIEVDAGGAATVTVDNDRRTARRARPGGHGLLGMRERLDTIGGTVEHGPHGAGWRVRAVVPPRARR
ncbi:sensor histidine kinase [Nocardia bovistercoris]|uniref:histidine kinase n=1 Tax=Nocardia bovistercoris TaxID=2785916 RepID=A0A931N600_9NOCA|nr:histidine kinase [Nocardia bovistercoris]MBH0780247.1 hypothetical protein [Nocardia bovistercoris]